jgi:hypothetical protein
MKKNLTISALLVMGFALLIPACQKSDQQADSVSSHSTNRASLNNLRIEAAVIKSWLADDKLKEIIFTFHSKNLSEASTNMTLIAFANDKNATILEVDSRSDLGVKNNIGFSNNVMKTSAIRRLVSKSANELIDFDYILLVPNYYEDVSGSYLRYKFIPYKNGSPVSGNLGAKVMDDDCINNTQPSPPANASLCDEP